MTSKRSSPDSEESCNSGGGREESPLTSFSGSNNEPSAKRPKLVTFEPVKLSSISSVAHLDAHVVTFQNRKLSERFQYKVKSEAKLRRRIEQLEKRQSQDDAMLCIINRYWNRLDEDVRLLLQRFDVDTSVETEDTEGEPENTTSFLAQLSHWDSEEIEEKLSRRVEFSSRAIGKIVQAFDRLVQRNDKITELLKSSTKTEDYPAVKKEDETSDRDMQALRPDQSAVPAAADMASSINFSKLSVKSGL